MEYRYDGLFSKSSAASQDLTGTVYMSSLSPTLYAGQPRVVYAEEALVSVTLSENATVTNGFMMLNKDAKLTIKALDRKMTEVKFDHVKWTASDNKPQQTAELTLHAGTYYNLSITFDLGLDGFPIIFREATEKKPKALPFPNGLKSEPDPWNKEVVLTWRMDSLSVNKDGYIKIERNHVLLADNLVASKNMDYTDKSAVYDSVYTYKILYMPEAWKGETADELTASVTTEMKHTALLDDSLFNIPHSVPSSGASPTYLLE